MKNKEPKLGLYFWKKEDAIYNLTYHKDREYMELIRVKKLSEKGNGVISYKGKPEQFLSYILLGKLELLTPLEKALYDLD